MDTKTSPLIHPWEGDASTCAMCLGPWGQNCIDGHGECLPVRIWWDNSYECAICRATVTTSGPMPKVSDDVAWRRIQAEHTGACVWARSRAYQLEGHTSLIRSAS